MIVGARLWAEPGRDHSAAAPAAGEGPHPTPHQLAYLLAEEREAARHSPAWRERLGDSVAARRSTTTEASTTTLCSHTSRQTMLRLAELGRGREEYYLRSVGADASRYYSERGDVAGAWLGGGPAGV